MESHLAGSGQSRRRLPPNTPAPRFRPPASGDSEDGGRASPPPGAAPTRAGGPTATCAVPVAGSES
eukprot:10725917-Alexandrium_andersonii.AAC.1